MQDLSPEVDALDSSASRRQSPSLLSSNFIQQVTVGAFHWEFLGKVTSYLPVTRKTPKNFPMERLPAVYTGAADYLLADFYGNR